MPETSGTCIQLQVNLRALRERFVARATSCWALEQLSAKRSSLIANTAWGEEWPAFERNPDVDSRYLWHWLTYVSADLAAKAKGATFKQVNREDIGELAISLPLLAEQRRIADVLDRADALLAKRRLALMHLDDLQQATFLDLFGNTTAWPSSTVAAVANPLQGAIRTGPFGSQLLHSEFTSDGVAVLGIDNVVQNEFRWGERRFISTKKYQDLRRYTVHPGDVLITIMGTCGRCAVVADDVPLAINTKHLCCITLDRKKCLPSFVHAYFLRHPIARSYLAQRAKGAIMAGLNMEIIRAMPIPIPPMDVQVAFERRLEVIHRTREAHSRALASLGALMVSLRRLAFSAQL